MISLDNEQLIGEGVEARVYYIDENTVVRVPKLSSNEKIVEKSFNDLRLLYYSGFPVPEPYKIDDVIFAGEKRKGLFMKKINGVHGLDLFFNDVLEFKTFFRNFVETWSSRARNFGVVLDDIGLNNVILPYGKYSGVQEVIDNLVIIDI